MDGARNFVGIVLVASQAIILSCRENVENCTLTTDFADEHPDVVSLLQRKLPVQSHVAAATCTALANKGTHFSVEVCVGTPKQCFNVVADTGSDSVIIPSCICDKMPGTGCGSSDTCFQGTNKSSTFSLNASIPGIAITFGSGTIESVIASDVVEVGGIKARLNDGVLLMVNRALLQIEGDFQGILGLGVPQDDDDDDAYALLQQIQDPVVGPSGQIPPRMREILCVIFPEICDDNVDPPWQDGVGHRHAPPAPNKRGDTEGVKYAPKLFLREANVDRFSMCFRDANRSGALRMNVPKFEHPISNIGKFHWGINFQGASVGPNGGEAPAETIFCGPETMEPGMDSPCGIIPDSGTTLILGPKKQVLALEREICNKWPRCRESGEPSSDTFRELLSHCGAWLTATEGLLEIPSVFFHSKNANGANMAFELTAWAWVTEYGNENSSEKICVSAFGPSEYPTVKNGPIWIVGTPLFYEYDVGYDLLSRQMALKQGHCEPCVGELDGPELALADASARYTQPRVVHGKPRIHRYDASIPL